MLKRFLFLSVLLTVVGTAFAVPAKHGVWKTLLMGGQPTTAQLMGDEYMHYWQTADGVKLVEHDGQFELVDMAHLAERAQLRRKLAERSRQHRAAQNVGSDFMSYKGKKKGLVILVEFANMKFQEGNDSLLYTRICNEENFSLGNFQGSVYDYFKAQSYGDFELTFDVAGPVLMEKNYQYYGADYGGQGDDAHPGEMVATACQMVADQVDFSDYDWDGDGVVDQVMVIYAGRGQADGGNSNTIWPHEWVLQESDYGNVLQLDGVIINTYAVANERSSYGIDGLGTICHEFSHCLGIPDMYDTRDNGNNFGMGEWSLMDSGCYNGNSFIPCGYTSFEKYMCGWVKPVLLAEDAVIQSMKALSSEPEAYMVRNDAYPNEYYLMENRRLEGWDSELPANGMLVIYVDYDRNEWLYNMVNSTNHPRCTPIRPSGSKSRWSSQGDVYPYNGLDSLTNTSNPAATLYHANTDGSKLMNKGILDIAQNDDGTMSFRFRNEASEKVSEDVLFAETFNRCAGTGGNDGTWATNIATSTFLADNEGWDVVKAYGGWMCARFGNASTGGKATTPQFSLADADSVAKGQYAVLTFQAASWPGDGNVLTLSVDGNATLEKDTVIVGTGAWTTCSVRLDGQGPVRVTFTPEHRFLLDNVQVRCVVPDIPDAIVSMPQDAVAAMPAGYYRLDGTFAGMQAKALTAGLYLRVDDHRRCHKVFIP